MGDCAYVGGGKPYSVAFECGGGAPGESRGVVDGEYSWDCGWRGYPES